MEIMAEDRIRVTMTDGVADVKLVRADKMNALDLAMFEALVETGERLIREPGLRAVVISGEGRAFCAGLDMGRFAAMAEGQTGTGMTSEARLLPRTRGDANEAQHAVMVWRKVPVPVIAAVHGVAFGGGMQLALGADLRFVTPDAKLSVLEIKWGLVPDMGGMLLLRNLVRGDVLRELTFTGRILSGTEAASLGLATRVCADPYAEAMALARDIAQKNPEAIRAGKRLCDIADNGDPAAILLGESAEQVKLIGSANQIEAVRANIEKRAPRFTDPAPSK
jgi:enoyl-CoA hydratase/carnithine racemase